MRSIRLGCGSAYWGDMLEPAVEMAERGQVHYMGFDHLAELTMSILQRIKVKDPRKGYIPDIVPFMKALLPVAVRKEIKIITNGGGANPEVAAEEVARLARSLGIRGLKIGVVLGDDISERITEMRAGGIKFRNLDTGEEDIDSIADRIVAAHAYIGADGIIEALRQGAQVVVTGRVSDNALFVGPIMYEFGWEYRHPCWDRVGAAITVGHILECAECCTGGLSCQWRYVEDPARIGFPIAEVYENGEAVITKTPGSGGLVNQWTIKEQLVYEIMDPHNYYMPDGIADFTTVRVEEVGPHTVRVSNMTGKPRPDTLKLQIGYEDGWIAEGLAILPWPDAYEKAKRCEEIVRERFRIVGLQAEEIRFDYIGVNALHGNVAPEPSGELNEVGLRISARTRTREEADKVRREVTHLWTLGGIGAAVGVPFKPREVISLWPTLVPRDQVRVTVSVREV